MVRRGFLRSTFINTLKHAFHVESLKRLFWEKLFILTVSVGLPPFQGRCLNMARNCWMSFTSENHILKVGKNLFVKFSSCFISLFCDGKGGFVWNMLKSFHSFSQYWRRNQEHHSRWWRLPTKTRKKQLKKVAPWQNGRRLWVGGMLRCWEKT